MAGQPGACPRLVPNGARVYLHSPPMGMAARYWLHGSVRFAPFIIPARDPLDEISHFREEN